ncbi:UNVERIFIED_CONTAM: Aluminum-activated malate transporter 2 [Sesamum calycinum]|uniref:Aluminum-activated malate transporter 2 n=1 Tax=Sesamum calycinum TaxID=2727403 RepID=A0AAW2JJF7_9LAMI
MQPSPGGKLGEEDPRRVVHSFKVGLAITLVSLFYYFDFSYEGFGVNAMWAVMTVVVVFEFSVGATLGKGVNRAIATLLGGALGVGAHRLASFTGEKIECIMLGMSVLLIAAATTFIRFFPKLRPDMIMGLLIHPYISSDYRCPATGTMRFWREYFRVENDKNQENKASLDVQKCFNSKGSEFCRNGSLDMVNLGIGSLGTIPKIGSLTRECAYKIDALNGYLLNQMCSTNRNRSKIQETCTKMSSECSVALRELAVGIKTMTCSLSADPHLLNAKTAAKKLKSLLKTNLWPETDLLEIVPAVTVVFAGD